MCVDPDVDGKRIMQTLLKDGKVRYDFTVAFKNSFRYVASVTSKASSPIKVKGKFVIIISR